MGHSMLLREYLLLCFVAALGGAVNSVAGGGTLLTFPALMALLTARDGSSAMASVLANGTSTVALFPGAIAAAWGYRRELDEARYWLKLLVGPSLAGGLLGSWLVTSLPAEWFLTLVPWLILTAALLFALQPSISRWAGVGQPHEAPRASTVTAVVLFQFVVGVYGGYFGAGIGILMLSALAIIGLSDIHVMNGLKSVLNSFINGVAVLVFIYKRQVDWPLATVMAIAAIAGGLAGALVARKMNRTLVRGIVVAIGFSLATYYFYRQWVDPTSNG
jgi:uncharacterized membrane protein YfcA